MNLTTQQLADILIGVARSQQAIIEGIEGLKAGFKGTYLAPALDSVAKIRSMGRPMSLQDFPARVLPGCRSVIAVALNYAREDDGPEWR